jgi:hypothetical protein
MTHRRQAGHRAAAKEELKTCSIKMTASAV